MSLEESPTGAPRTPPGSSPADAPIADERWLDRPGSVNFLIKVLIGVSAGTAVADFFYHKHVEYAFQEWPGFDALYGFVSCVGLVLAAKGLRVLLMRREDYYD